MTFFLDRKRLFLFGYICLTVFGIQGLKADEKIRFEIPKGDATQSFTKFAMQSGSSLFYTPDIVEGIQIEELRGMFGVQEALSLLLKDTPLEFIKDVETGAFAIVRSKKLSTNPAGGHPKGSAKTNPKQHREETMNKKKTFLGKLLSSLAGIVVVTNTSPLSAQNEDFADEDVYELSPFVIAESENVGYLATSTLAGTRIKTNLADVGSAISVLTPEVFADTGATDAESILPYSLNVEVAGVQGNFANPGNAGGSRLRANSTARNSQAGTRVRGLSSALLARGLFRTDIPFDSYNTSAVTINRGPNSLLFGATTPGGVIDQSLNQAQFGKDFGKFEIRIGERKSHREVLDYNKVIVKNRLAVRLALLNDDIQYQQSPTYKRDQRAYVTATAILHEGSDGGILGRTKLRANFENGKVESNPPKITPPGDALTDWFEVPDRDLQQYTGTVFPDYVDNFIPKQTIDNRLGTMSINDATLPMSQPFFINMSIYYHQPNLESPSMGVSGLEYVGGMPARTLWRGVLGKGRVDTWGTYPFFGGIPGDFAPGFTVPVIMDRNVFDNQNMAITGTLGYRNYDFDAQNIALEQELFDGKAGIEIAYDRQSYENNYYDPFSGAGHGGNSFRGYDIRIDLMEYLPNDMPNPNLGRAYMVDFNTPHYAEKSDRESKRATAFYDLDFTENEGFSRWFGRHVFTGFYSHSTVDSERRDIRNKWIDVPGSPWEVQTLVNDRLNGERRNVPIMAYLSDVLLGPEIQSMSDIRINNYMTFSAPQPGDRVVNHFHSFFNTPAATDGPAVPLEEGEFEVYRSLFGGNAVRQVFEGKALSWQSFLFDGNLVGLIGWRDDRFKTVENISLTNFVNETPDAFADGLLESGEYDGRRIRIADEDNPDHAEQVSSVSNETLTWSLVGHVPEELLKLPYGANLSFHYNESETFVPTRARRDFNGNVLGPETGETKEYGFTVQLFEKKLSVRVNFFELSQNNATATGGPGAPSNTGWFRFWKDAELTGIPFEEALMTGLDSRPVLTPDITSYEEMYQAFLNVMPQTQRDLFNIRFGPDGRTVLADPNPGQTVTTNAISEGIEIDVVGNITDNWRVMFNWGQQETVTADSAPVAGEYVLAVAENLKTSGLDVVTFVPSLFEYNPLGRLWNEQVNSLNALRARDGTVSLEQRKHRVNLLSTYSFLSDSRLNGLTIGGAIRWQSAVATGYETEVNEGVVTPIISKPFWGPEELNGDVWVSYERPLKIFNRDVDWKIQLNVRNAIGSDDYIPVVTNPNGEVAVVRNPPTQEWFLTNTISF